LCTELLTYLRLHRLGKSGERRARKGLDTKPRDGKMTGRPVPSWFTTGGAPRWETNAEDRYNSFIWDSAYRCGKADRRAGHGSNPRMLRSKNTIGGGGEQAPKRNETTPFWVGGANACTKSYESTLIGVFIRGQRNLRRDERGKGREPMA